MLKAAVASVAFILLLGACSEKPSPSAEGAVAGSSSEASTTPGKSEDGGGDPVNGGPTDSDRPAKVDPRKNGFEITLGEWAVTLEAPALRPGRVTFVIHNRGTMEHGFEIELEGDSSGSGSGDLFKAESDLLQPGESTRMTVTLGEGVHKIECLVDGHDDMGMEGPLDVRKEAPLVKNQEKQTESDGAVAIEGFAFTPDSITVVAGTSVSWSNNDPTAHTVSAEDDSFDSDVLDPGKRFSFTFVDRGTYSYICNVHPDMKGTVKVE